MTTVSLDVTGRMLLGTDAAAVLAILESLHVDIIGFNCSTGPEHMREPIRYITSHTTLPVACIPNAGLPLNVDGRAHYPLEPVPDGNRARELRAASTGSASSADAAGRRPSTSASW